MLKFLGGNRLREAYTNPLAADTFEQIVDKIKGNLISAPRAVLHAQLFKMKQFDGESAEEFLKRLESLAKSAFSTAIERASAIRNTILAHSNDGRLIEYILEHETASIEEIRQRARISDQVSIANEKSQFCWKESSE